MKLAPNVFARWEAETAKHYLKHHRFVCVNADVELDALSRSLRNQLLRVASQPSLLRRLQPMQSPPSWSRQLDFDDPVS